MYMKYFENSIVMGSIMRGIKLLFASSLHVGECKMILIVRSDLPMTKGKVGAQCAHAALECYRRASSSKSGKEILNAWLSLGQPKIVVRIPNEKELLTLAKDATNAGLFTAVIRDAGKTQLQAGTISVLGIGPAPATALQNLTSHLKLL